MDIPMLDDEEFELCNQAKEKGREFVEKEINNRNTVKYEWLGEIPKSYERFRYFIDMYRVITGFLETNPNAIFHHTINSFGPDCPSCGKPLRTLKSKYCVYCGLGKEDIITDSRPLIEKRPDIFKDK